MESFGFRAHLPGQPTEHLAILTCMDSRVEPKKLLGLEVGEANIIRNAGARATDDAIRSLTASTKFLGVDTIFVIHHTNCGMAQRSDEEVLEDLSDGTADAENITWRSITGEPEALVNDVTRLRSSPLIAPEIPIYGFLMDIETGGIIEVPQAITAGATVQKDS